MPTPHLSCRLYGGETEHVILADCKYGQGILSLQMAYYSGAVESSTQPLVVVTVKYRSMQVWEDPKNIPATFHILSCGNKIISPSKFLPAETMLDLDSTHMTMLRAGPVASTSRLVTLGILPSTTRSKIAIIQLYPPALRQRPPRQAQQHHFNCQRQELPHQYCRRMYPSQLLLQVRHNQQEKTESVKAKWSPRSLDQSQLSLLL